MAPATAWASSRTTYRMPLLKPTTVQARRHGLRCSGWPAPGCGPGAGAPDHRSAWSSSTTIGPRAWGSSPCNGYCCRLSPAGQRADAGGYPRMAASSAGRAPSSPPSSTPTTQLAPWSPRAGAGCRPHAAGGQPRTRCRRGCRSHAQPAAGGWCCRGRELGAGAQASLQALQGSLHLSGLLGSLLSCTTQGAAQGAVGVGRGPRGDAGGAGDAGPAPAAPAAVPAGAPAQPWGQGTSHALQQLRVPARTGRGRPAPAATAPGPRHIGQHGVLHQLGASCGASSCGAHRWPAQLGPHGPGRRPACAAGAPRRRCRGWTAHAA